MFVVVHPRSTLSVRCRMVPPQNVEVENTLKFGVFAPREQHSKPIRMKFRTISVLDYMGVHAKLGRDRRMG